MSSMIGLVGLGANIRHHLSAFVRSRHCDAVRLAAPDTDARAALVRRFGIIKQVSDGYEALLADPGIALVDVCTPLASRESAIAAALAAGKHVLADPPFAATIQAAQALMETASAADLRLLPVLPERFIPAHLRARQLLPEIGDPLFAGITRLTTLPDLSDGALLQYAYHEIDLLQHLFTPAAAATATIDPTGALVLVSLEFPRGLCAQVSIIANATGDHPSAERRLVGDQGSFLIRDNPEDELPLIGFQGDEVFPIRLKNPPDIHEYAVMEAIEHHLHLLAGNRPAEPTAADALSALVTTLGAQKSATDHCRVALG